MVTAFPVMKKAPAPTGARPYKQIMSSSFDIAMTRPRIVDAWGIPDVVGGASAPIRMLRVSDRGAPTILRHGGYERDGSWWMARRDGFPFDHVERHLPRAARRSLVPEIVDLIPASSWFASLANLLSRDSWQSLRLPLVDHHEGCQDCGHGSRLEAHEAWSYDESQGIQTLDGILVLCRFCHETRHLGRARAMGRFDEVFGRLCRINRIMPEERGSYLHRVSSLWEMRSRIAWELRLPIPEDMILELRPSVRHAGDGWLVMPATPTRGETSARVIDVGVGEMNGRVVLVGLSPSRIAAAYGSSDPSCISSEAGLASGTE